MKWLLIIPLLAIVSCGDIPEQTKPIVIQSKPITRPKLNLPNVDQYTAQEVNWIVVTPDNVTQVLSEMEARGEAPALFAVTEKGYENISINTQKSLSLILQQQAVIDGYREYYITIDNKIREHNSTVDK